jgi:hypothetical protein
MRHGYATGANDTPVIDRKIHGNSQVGAQVVPPIGG